MAQLNLFGQNQPFGTGTGGLKGTVKDSIHNTYLQSATVAVYRSKDSTLVKYQLTNNFGEFQFSGLPLDTGLKVVISYIGYKKIQRSFSLTKDSRLVDLKVLYVERGEEQLESAVVTPPPVRMNGDTLEFNAAAFELDKNAVAEDLIKKLPGVIVWGDGTITVNGKQIKELLVEGKPFFGGDPKIATQNLPKDAIQKVQIYKEQINPYNPLDSITTMNIRLKSGARKGLFGEIAAGYGTDHQYQFDGSLNSYSPRNLMGVSASSNNVNKLPADIYALMRNSTYKGVSATVDYQPDFNLQGTNKSNSAGLIFQHDFIPDASSSKQNRFTTSAFADNTINQTIRNSHIITSTGFDSLLTSDNNNRSKTNNKIINLQSKYELKKGENTFNLAVSAEKGNKNSNIQQENSVYTSNLTPENNQSAKDSSDVRSGSLSMTMNYVHQGFSNSNTHKLTNWQADYSISAGNDDTSRLLRENFSSVSVPEVNQRYFRTFENHSDRINQNISFKLGDFATWLFGSSKKLSQLNIYLKDDVAIRMQNIDNRVHDLDTVNNQFISNSYLSNKGVYLSIDEVPKISVARTFLNILANRYQKSIILDLYGGLQFNSQQSTSNHALLNYSRDYIKPTVSAGIVYSNFRFSSYLNNFDLHFREFADYPNFYQLYPLVDSSSVYNIRFGNPNLAPYTVDELAFVFRHDGYRSGNTFNYGVALRGKLIRNYFADSAILDPSGRYYYYTVNMNGYREIDFDLFLNKAIKAGGNQLQVNFMPHGSVSQIPGFIKLNSTDKAVNNLSKTFMSTDTVSVTYTLKDILAVNLSEISNFYHSRQTGLTNYEFSSSIWQTRLGIGSAPTKKVMLHTSVTYVSSKSSSLQSTAYTIWNADLGYRLLQDNTLELKLSALDLLHQNKGILNYGSTYSLTRETVNVLQQYFMLTIAYYPRKFNKRRSASPQ